MSHNQAVSTQQPMRKSCEFCRQSGCPVQQKQVLAIVCGKCFLKHSTDQTPGISTGHVPSKTIDSAVSPGYPEGESDSDSEDSVFQFNTLIEMRAQATKLINKTSDTDKMLQVIELLRGAGDPNPVYQKLTEINLTLRQIDQKLNESSPPVCATRNIQATYSDITKRNRGHFQQSSVNMATAITSKVKYDPERTLIIEKVKDKSLVSSSINIKKNLSTHFPRTKFEQAFKTARGNVQIQLDDRKTANEILERWSPDMLGGGTNIRKPIAARTGLIRDLDTSISDADLKSDINKYFDGVKLERFKNKENNPLPLAKIVFNSNEDLTSAIKTGITVGQMICSVEEFTFKRKPLRCYKCQSFNHTAKWCGKSVKCGKCAESHNTKDCSSECTKCCNCSNDHPAWSRQCPAYIREETRLNTNDG